MNARRMLPALVVLVLLVGGWFLFRTQTKEKSTESKPAPASTNENPTTAADPSEPLREQATVDLLPPDASLGESGVRAQLPWGPEGVGRGTSEDGYPGGPNSFVVGPDGATWIIDQFNQRLIKVGPDGKILASQPLKLTSPADLALGKDGTVAIIDRTRDQKVEVFDAQGRSRGTLPLPDAVPGQPSELTRVFVNEDKVYAQRGEGGPLIPLGGLDGRAGGGAEVNGQYSRDGTLLLAAGITDYDVGRVWVSGADVQSGDHLFTREFNLDNAIEQILLFDSDTTGIIYLVLKAIFDDEGSASSVMVLCLDGQQRAKVTRVFSLPYPAEPLDTFRKFDVAPEGGLLAAEYTESGVTYRMHSCR